MKAAPDPDVAALKRVLMASGLTLRQAFELAGNRTFSTEELSKWLAVSRAPRWLRRQ